MSRIFEKESFLIALAKKAGLVDIRAGFGLSPMNVVICFRQLKQTAIHEARKQFMKPEGDT